MKNKAVLFLLILLASGLFFRTEILTAADDDLVSGLKEALDVGTKKELDGKWCPPSSECGNLWLCLQEIPNRLNASNHELFVYGFRNLIVRC